MMKTTFDFNFIYIKLLNMDTLKNMKTKKSWQLKKLIFINLQTCDSKKAKKNN